MMLWNRILGGQTILPRLRFWSKRDAWRLEQYLDGNGESWVKKRFLDDWGDASKTDFLNSKRSCQDSGFNFLETIFKTMLRSESDALKREQGLETRAILGREKRNLGQKTMLDDGSDAWFERRIFGEQTILPRLRIQLLSGYLIRIDGQSEKARGKTMLAQSSDAWRWVRWRWRGAMVRCEKRDSGQKRSFNARCDPLMLEAILDARSDSLMLGVVLDARSNCLMVGMALDARNGPWC